MNISKKGQGAIEAPFEKACTEKAIAQGAIEYLLIIATAILIVAIVIVSMTGVVDVGQTNLKNNPIEDIYSDLTNKISDLTTPETNNLNLSNLTPPEIVCVDGDSSFGDKTAQSFEPTGATVFENGNITDYFPDKCVSGTKLIEQTCNGDNRVEVEVICIISCEVARCT